MYRMIVRRRFHGYLDTQRIAAACDEMTAAGIAEAAAAPIGDA